MNAPETYLVPRTSVESQRFRELIVAPRTTILQGLCSARRRAAESMGERLVLNRRSRDRSRDRQVRTLQIGRGEVRQPMSDGR